MHGIYCGHLCYSKPALKSACTQSYREHSQVHIQDVYGRYIEVFNRILDDINVYK